MVIWVVGDNTNVGKTTITAALIRVLNGFGKAAIGYKPYAGARLLDVIDLLEEIAAGDGYLVGRDARKLLKASPWVPQDFLEVINPSWRISHPVRDASVFIRKGSAAIGQRTLLRTENAKDFWTRPDLQKLNAVTRLPIQSMQIIGNSVADKVDFDDQGIQAASFKRLQSLNPDILVCEGAGRLLPVWKGAPAARHLFVVSGGDLYFFHNVRLNAGQSEGSFGPFTIDAITPQLASWKRLKAAIPLARHSCLDEDMENFIRPFAAACVRP